MSIGSRYSLDQTTLSPRHLSGLFNSIYRVRRDHEHQLV